MTDLEKAARLAEIAWSNFRSKPTPQSFSEWSAAYHACQAELYRRIQEPYREWEAAISRRFEEIGS